MGAERSHLDLGQADFIEAGEELLHKAHAVARRIDRRVWKAMGRHGPPAPNGPDAPGHGPAGADDGRARRGGAPR